MQKIYVVRPTYLPDPSFNVAFDNIEAAIEFFNFHNHHKNLRYAQLSIMEMTVYSSAPTGREEIGKNSIFIL